MTTPAPSVAPRCSSSHRPLLRLALVSSLLVAGSAGVAWGQAPVPAGEAARETQVTAAGCLATEADFVRANGMRPWMPGVDLTNHVVLVDAAGTTFAINGTRERDLLTRAGSRVEVSGTLEGWSSDTSLERLPEDVPLGAPAHEPSDASVARVEGPVLTPPALPRINVRTFRAIDGSCASLVRATDSAKGSPADGERPAVARVAASTPTVERVRVQGCILRDPSGSDRLVLSQVVARRPDGVSTSAVPGSLPSGSGTGTTAAPRAVATAGATQAFYLVGQDKLTTVLLGSRAEIVGTLAATDATPAARGTGHVSAAVRALTVETVRSIGGACAP